MLKVDKFLYNSSFLSTFVVTNKFNNDRIMITKEQFEKLAYIELIEENGKLVYNDGLYLEGRTDIKELPDNLRILGGLDLRNSGVTKLPKGLDVECWLEISGTEIEELPEDTKFGGHLYVRNMKKPFSFQKEMRVNGEVYWGNTTIKQMPERLYISHIDSLIYTNLDSIKSIDVYRYLNLNYTGIFKLCNNLVAYRGLELDGTPIKELPEGLIVGSWLNLGDTNLIDYSNLHKVCTNFTINKETYEKIKDVLVEHNYKETFYLSDTIDVTFKPNYKGAYLFENENGRYIDADDMFAKIIKQKGNVYHIQMDGSGEISYLITNGEGRWAHGDTLEEAKDDLLFKIGNRNKDDYWGLTLDSELSFEDAIVCYRVITGACSFGTRDFIEHRLGENKKDKYTISEIIELTEGEYGNKIFREFFYKQI